MTTLRVHQMLPAQATIPVGVLVRNDFAAGVITGSEVQEVFALAKADPQIAYMLSRMWYPDFPVPVGVLRRVARITAAPRPKESPV